MKRIAEQSAQLVTDAQIIADNLAEYNPGLCKKKVPLQVIQHDLATLMREFAILYGNIGEKVKDEL